MDSFLLQVVLSFIVGGAYIAITIWVSEKFGSRWGGIFISLPSTTLMSLLFIGITQGETVVGNSLPITPFSIAAQGVFIISFKLFQRFGIVKSLISAAIVWFAFTLPLVFYGIKDIWLSVTGALIVLVFVLYVFRKIVHRKLENHGFSKTEFLMRAVFCGLVIAISVALAKSFGPLWGGLLATFPAATLSSLFLLARSHGNDFAISVTKTMPIGSAGNVVFVVSLYHLLPIYGLLLGIIISYAMCAIATIILVKLLSSY